jgi:hypothetical protein
LGPAWGRAACHAREKLLRELERSSDLVDLDRDGPFAEFLERRGELVRVS